MSTQFSQLCKDEQIIMEKTIPYAHWQLASIEKQMTTLSKGAKTLLAMANLPDKLWGHAFLTMVYIRSWWRDSYRTTLKFHTGAFPLLEAGPQESMLRRDDR